MKLHRAVVLAFAFVLLSAHAAVAVWSSPGAGAGSASARFVGVPTAVAATPTGTTSIQVSWAAPGGASVAPTGYRVNQVSAPAGPVCTVGAGTFTCPHTGLVGGSSHSYTVEALIGSAWSSGPSGVVSATTPAPGPFVVALAPVGTKTAGVAFNVNLTATLTGGATDTSYSGAKTILFSGPSISPLGTAPLYPATVNFTAGIGTASITLYAAQATTLTATEGVRSGSTPVTVAPATAARLRFAGSSHDCADGSASVGFFGTFTSYVSMVDTFGNAVAQSGSNRTVGISGSGGIFPPSPSTLTIPVGASQTSDDLSLFVLFGTTTITASSTGLLPVSCAVS